MKTKLYDKLVSIIVPVYNAEQYLKRCINSLLNQKYKNIEVILINDGSNDNSGKTCDEFALQYKNVKVIHQKNAGPSFTRNRGIDVAKGEYIQFVDSDDYIEPDMTQKMVDSLSKNVELVICGYKSTFLVGGNNVFRNNRCPIEGKYKFSEFMSHFSELFRNTLINPLWNKLYITNLIRKNNVRFKENIKIGEDLLFNLEYFKACDNVIVIDESLYNYLIISNNSLTNSFNKEYFRNQQMLFEILREFLSNNNNYIGKNKELIEMCYAESIVSCLEHIFHENSNLTSILKKEQINNIVKDKSVRKNISYFKDGNIQKRCIGLFINYNSINGVYYYFKGKNFLRKKVRPVFKLFKIIN